MRLPYCKAGATRDGRLSGHPGFTLVELLVVIGIIATLIAMLLPALTRAMNSSKRLVCQSNLRQIYLATLCYSQDNRGTFPCAWLNPPSSFGCLAVPKMLTNGAPKANYLPNGAVWNCPSDLTRGKDYCGNNAARIPGGYSSFNWFTDSLGNPTDRTYINNISYGYNRTAGFNDPETNSGKSMWFPYRPERRHGQSLYDAIWFDMEPGTDTGGWAYLYQTARLRYTTGGNSDSMFSGRHDGYLNIVGADGHVETLKIRKNMGTLPGSQLRPWSDDVSNGRVNW